MFVFSNTFMNTLYVSYKNYDNYNQYINDIYIYTYIHRHISTYTDRQRKNLRFTGFKGFEW